MTNFKKLAALASVLALYPTLTLAEVAVGDLLGTTNAEIRASLESAGYSVDEVEIEDGEIEAEAVINGQSVEIDISPENGTILALESDDTEQDDDDDSDDGDNDDDDDDKDDGDGDGGDSKKG